MRLQGRLEFGDDWAEVIQPISDLYALAGEPIGWLGYAPKGQEYKEPYGVEYGFAGVDMREYGEATLMLFYSGGKTFADKQVVGRIEVREYPVTEEYILFVTTLNKYGLPDGSRYDYHIPADPRGGACMFRVRAGDFETAMGWQP